MLDDIRTEAHRLGELETAFIRVANEVKELKQQVLRVNHELAELATRVDTLEVLVAYDQPPRRWWQLWRA